METIRIEFGREDFIHPNVATHWKYMRNGHYVETYMDDVVRAHHLASLFPTVDYRTIMAIVKGSVKLEAVDNEEFYGVIISDIAEKE